MYASDWLKAAAMLESIALALTIGGEERVLRLADRRDVLNTNGITLDYEPEEALALVMRAKHKGARVQEVAAQLRAWVPVDAPVGSWGYPSPSAGASKVMACSLAAFSSALSRSILYFSSRSWPSAPTQRSGPAFR
ncbi:hypothetical protein ABZ408_41145 [Streptomyces tibetensis]|uniref:hypothetical protein n=1 Tax=Streptomyces tibetensis TaxID=2382123 RepID=UPI0033C414A8